MEEISKHFRLIASEYSKLTKKFSRSIYQRFIIIYTYHEYAISAYFNFEELYKRYESIIPTIKFTTDLEFITTKNAYLSTIFGLYSHGGVVLDILRPLNELIKKDGNNEQKEKINKICEKYKSSMKNFKDIRNSVTAHPFDDGEKGKLYLTMPNSEGKTITFHVLDIERGEFCNKLIVNPQQDFNKLNGYISEISHIYKVFFTP